MSSLHLSSTRVYYNNIEIPPYLLSFDERRFCSNVMTTKILRNQVRKYSRTLENAKCLACLSAHDIL